MHNAGTLWIDSVDIEIDGHDVVVLPVSDGVQFKRRMSRSRFRRFIEIARRKLDLADAMDMDRVVPFGMHG